MSGLRCLALIACLLSVGAAADLNYSRVHFVDASGANLRFRGNLPAVTPANGAWSTSDWPMTGQCATGQWATGQRLTSDRGERPSCAHARGAAATTTEARLLYLWWRAAPAPCTPVALLQLLGTQATTREGQYCHQLPALCAHGPRSNTTVADFQTQACLLASSWCRAWRRVAQSEGNRTVPSNFTLRIFSFDIIFELPNAQPEIDWFDAHRRTTLRFGS